MRILVSYRGIPQSPGWATGDMVVKAFRELGHEVFAYAKYYQEERWVEELPRTIQMDGVDLILFMECNDGDRQYTELRTLPARKMACWLFDTSYYPDQCHSLIKWFNFDHIFLANPLTLQHYKAIGYKNVQYLPYGCDSELHSRPLEYPKNRSVALVGSDRPDRRQLVRDLAASGINLELISDVFRESYIDALASSRIIVNQNPEAGRGLLNMRFFEGAAAGSVVFTEFEDYKVNYDSGLALPRFTYKNTEELAESIRFLLNDREHLEIIAHRDQENILEHNSYKNRCQEILEWYEGN